MSVAAGSRVRGAQVMAAESVSDSAIRRLGGQALEKLDKVLRDRPEKIGYDFSEAVRDLVLYRDALAQSWRETGGEPGRGRLARINAVLSVLVGGHFPLGSVPWELIQKAREQLAAIVADNPPCVG